MASTLPLTQLENDLREKVAISCRIIGNRGVTRGAFVFQLVASMRCRANALHRFRFTRLRAA